MEHETEHIERPPLSDPDLPGFFLGVLDDAHPGNALRDIDGDVAGYRTRLTKGIVNALILCGVRPWVHDAAAVMNPILGELWRDGWWRDALTGRHVCVLSRGQSIFTDYQRWTRNGTRHPDRKSVV